jgi:hypothetical protein
MACTLWILVVAVGGGAIVVAIWDLIGVFALWPSHGLKSTLPFALALAFIFAFIPIRTAGFRSRMDSFKARLPEYDEIVRAIRTGDARHIEGAVVDEGVVTSIKFPRRLHHLAWYAHVVRATNDEFTVMFVYAGGFGHDIADYVYSSNGDISPLISRGMFIQSMITTNWYATTWH